MKLTIYRIISLFINFRTRMRYRGFKSACNLLIFEIFYLIRWRWWINLLTRWVPLPICLEIEVSTACNLRCKLCELTYWDEPPKLMSLEEFRSIVDQFPKLRWIAMTGIGENFLNKDFLEMYRYVKKKWPHIYIELYDTFFFVDEEISRILLEEIKIDRVLISFDAATKKTYELLRVFSDFERVVTNIENFIKMKQEKGLFYPTTMFHFVINKLNITELLDYIDFVASLNKGKDCGIQFTRMLHRFAQVEDLFVEIPYSLIREAEEKGRKLGVNISWNMNISTNRTTVDYCGNWMMPFIFVTGEVIPCCAMNEANVRLLQKERSLGNIFNNSFKDIWNGQRYKRLRKDIRQGQIPFFCFNCPIFLNANLKFIKDGPAKEK